MKIIKIAPVIIFVILYFSSCTEIIQLDLKNTNSRVVIEAVLNVSDSTFMVNITESNDFYEEGEFNRISGAEVILQKINGISYNIPESVNGVYFLNNIIAEPEDQFEVSITDVDGNTYSARTITPCLVEISNIIPALFEPPGGMPQNDTTQYFQILTFWIDSVGVDNYYRLKNYVNNEFSAKNYLLTDDRINDGDTLGAMVIKELYSGDKLKLELLSTDKEYYQYFMDISMLQGQGPGGITPYNPKGNFDNGALGYFGIYTVSGFEFTIP